MENGKLKISKMKKVDGRSSKRKNDAGQLRCSRCGKHLDPKAFAIDKSRPYGRRLICRQCTKPPSRADLIATPSLSGGRVKYFDGVNCSHCSKPIKYPNKSTISRVRRGLQKNVFCNIDCQAAKLHKPEAHLKVCSICGVVVDCGRDRTPVKYRAGGVWICKSCRNEKRARICKVCGVQFYPRHYQKVSMICSWKCKRYLQPPKNCRDCGVGLNNENHTHAHKDHRTCDVCEYIRRCKYKDRARYGKENLGIMGTIRAADNIRKLGQAKLGGSPFRGNEQLLEKVVNRQSEVGKTKPLIKGEAK